MEICKNFNYPINIKVEYDSDSEYRKVIRRIMNMVHVKTDIEDADDVSKDELDYDTDAAFVFMDILFENTRRDNDLLILYTAAASALMSLDPATGIVVLFSYDNFKLFHECLRYYFENPDDGIINNEKYKVLMNKMKN